MKNVSGFICPYEGLGMLYYKQNKSNKAQLNLKISVQKRPEIVNEKYFILYKLYMDNYQFNEANFILDKWLEYEPYSKKALSLKKNLTIN